MNQAKLQEEERRVNAECAKLQSKINFISSQQNLLLERYNVDGNVYDSPAYEEWNRLEKEKSKVSLQMRVLVAEWNDKQKQKYYNKNALIIFAVFIIAIIAAIGLIFIIANKDTSEIGTTKTHQGIELTVNEYRTALSYNDLNAAEGNCFVIVDVTMKNVGHQSLSASKGQFRLFDDNNVELYAYEVTFDDLSIGAYESVRGKVIFQATDGFIKNLPLKLVHIYGLDECTWVL